jgi:transcriptional regulator of acetoin/glycerol metabolism
MGPDLKFESIMRDYIYKLGEYCGWNKKQMSKESGLGRATIYRYIQKYGFLDYRRSPLRGADGTDILV